MPKAGDKAPSFELVSDTGATIRLDDFKGKRVIVYFYPKADTPGCTKQACAIQDIAPQISDAGVTGSPRACSGLIYPAVPSTVPIVVSPAWESWTGALPSSSMIVERTSASSERARPKSRTLTDPSPVRSTSSGLRSR